jgi:DNA-binding NarL/FixJ family response regulator
VSRTKILVADEATVFRAAVRSLLARESDLDVADAADLDGVVRQVAAGPPDIALIDLGLPPLGAAAAVTYLRRFFPETRTVVWSFEATPEGVLNTVRGGAIGYLTKNVSAHGLVRALRGVLRGESPLPRHLTAAMIEALHNLDEREKAAERSAALSAREREVLSLVADGFRNRDIARELFISEATVKRHVQNILRKLGTSTRREAVEMFQAAGGLAASRGRLMALRTA